MKRKTYKKPTVQVFQLLQHRHLLSGSTKGTLGDEEGQTATEYNWE